MSKKSNLKLIKNIIRVAAYTRISEDAHNYDEHGNRKPDCTVDVQKQKNRDEVGFLSRRTGKEYQLKPEHELCDDGYSGKNVKRPGYQKLWGLIQNREIDVVVASELSRLSRTIVDFVKFVDHCSKNKVDIIIIGMNIDTTTEMGKFFMTIMIALAEFERKITGHRVRSNAYARLIKDGKINGGAEILGLIRDPDRKGFYIPHQEDLKKAEAIMKYYLELPSREAVHERIRDDKEMVSHKGKKITPRMIEYVLRNAKWRYRGLWYANKENKDHETPESLPENLRYREIDLKYKPVIDIGLLDKVVAKLENTKKNHKKTGTEKYTYLLANLLFDDAGNPFKGESTNKNGERYRYYRSATTGFRIHADKIHKTIERRVEEYLQNETVLVQILKEFSQKESNALPTVDAELRKVRDRIHALGDESSALSKTLLKPESKNPGFMEWLQSQIEGLQSKQEALTSEEVRIETERKKILDGRRENDIKKRVREFAKGFAALPDTIKRTTLERLYEAIIIEKNNKLRLVIRGREGDQILGKKKSSTVTGREDVFSYQQLNGGSDGTRTHGLRRDRAAL